MNLGIVIVNWNVKPLLRKALSSIYAALPSSSEVSWQVWVVDNASTDGSVDMLSTDFPWVHTLPLTENMGFGAANNLALFALGLLPGRSTLDLYSRSFPLARTLVGDVPSDGWRPDAVLFLNPDTEVTPQSLTRLLKALFANPRTGMVGPRLEYPDGQHQHSAFEFPGFRQMFLEFFPLHPRLYHSRLNGRYAKVLYQGKTPFPVDFILGAAMMVRAEVIEEVGGFDEGYWLYCEEMDWARRIRAAGWEIRVDPTALVIHYEGQSSRQFRERAFVALWESRLRYFQKYHSPMFNLWMHKLIRLGLYKWRWHALRLPPQERSQRLQAYAKLESLLARYQQ